jgi:SAM-dependent methyltransferase
MTTENQNVWDGAYKIPWDDPDFSKRMLAEHLSQDHDMASRRAEWIDRQVAWIHDDVLHGQDASVLDLGCGPGFYSHRLAALGHRCRGLDFSPASIEYALAHNPAPSRCEFALGDIRAVDFGGPYDLAMILFGELNVFSPTEALAILRKAHASLRPGGFLIAEVQAPEAVERVGRAEPVEQHHESGLFSDLPYECRTESRWLADQRVAVQTFLITDANGGNPREYRNTTQAWPDSELIGLFVAAGFHGAAHRDEWPCNTPNLRLWSAGGN